MGYNKITLYGGQTCDYFYVQSDPIKEGTFNAVKSEPLEWTDNTIIFSKFNEDLSAGDSSIKDRLEGYELRRRKGADNLTEKIATIMQGGSKYVVDYSAKNRTRYTYYLYPTIKPKATSEQDDKAYTFLPLISSEVQGDWNYWSLMVVDETEDENVFFLNKLFKFELNLSTDEMNNNASVTITPNFTRYPTLQFAPPNYWSGRVTALSGYITCADTEYIQTPDMIEELKALTSDTRRKFLKDIHGNLWEVKITAPISISTEDNTVERVKSVSISWCEVADASGVSIINNPNTGIISWLLTESGEAKPYIEYVWDNESRWDNSLRWTARDDLLVPEVSNMGRELTNTEV